jgi:hypothetical protein
LDLVTLPKRKGRDRKQEIKFFSAYFSHVIQNSILYTTCSRKLELTHSSIGFSWIECHLPSLKPPPYETSYHTALPIKIQFF